MMTMKNCDVTIFNDGKIAWVTLSKNPDYNTMMKLGKGKPCHDTICLSLEYKLNGLTYFLNR